MEAKDTMRSTTDMVAEQVATIAGSAPNKVISLKEAHAKFLAQSRDDLMLVEGMRNAEINKVEKHFDEMIGEFQTRLNSIERLMNDLKRFSEQVSYERKTRRKAIEDKFAAEAEALKKIIAAEELAVAHLS